MGNKGFGCDFCIRDRKNKDIDNQDSFDREDPLRVKIEKFIKIHSKFILSKSKEKLIYYSFITSSMYVLFSQSFYMALTSESIYVIDEYMMNVIKRIPLQYVISIMKCENSGNIGIVHYSQSLKTPIMVLNVKESKEILEIPKIYTEEIMEKIQFFIENVVNNPVSITSTKNFKEEEQEILKGNKNSYELYSQIKNEFKGKIEERLEMKKTKLIRIYFASPRIQTSNPKNENEEEEEDELTFLVLMEDRLVIFEGKEAFLDIVDIIPFEELNTITCNEFIEKFILRNEKVNREFHTVYTSEIVLAIKAFAPSVSIRILNSREYNEHKKSTESRAASTNISKVNVDTGDRKDSQKTDIKTILTEGQENLITTYESESKLIHTREEKEKGGAIPSLKNDSITKESPLITQRKPIELEFNEQPEFKDFIIKLPPSFHFDSPLPTPFSIDHEDSIIDGEDLTTENLLKMASVRLWKAFKDFND